MKKRIFVITVSSVLLLSTCVFAENGLQKITAFLRPSLAITLNGQKTDLESPPIMVDGSTYLKLRDVAKLTGVEVYWNAQTQTVELVNVAASTSTMSNFTYVDGDYSATGQYGSLPSSITVNVTLDDDIITNVKVTPHASNPTSLDLQRRFAEAVPAVVVGKRIDEVKVGRLAGSSGTPDGFNAAIELIKEQAKGTDDSDMKTSQSPRG
ncbi:stalk domain-containing protein [Candidatus Pristimantibacillus sp. PTI5]|uniref:stalk domain-containing protein n=1 Tax=Candidatus Pristimantibacillus sp. PTI5 TaxID=3400422 RepID=UPI003B02C951